MIRLGVVGLGVMGRNHARVYTELGYDLVGVADVDREQAQLIGQKYKIDYYTDYRELIPKVDVVSIAVPTTLHIQVACDFLEKGIHCLVEKPIASSIEEAEVIVESAEANNAKLAVGHIERFNPAVKTLKQIIEQGKLGKIIMISARRVGPFANRIKDVGIIIDLASHDIDVIRHLVSREPAGVFSKANRFKHATKEDHASIIMDFDDITASVEANWFTPHKVRTLVVTGSEGIAYLDYLEQTLTIYNNEGEWRVRIHKAEPLKLELQHFLYCIENNMEPMITGFDGLQTLSICLGVTSGSSRLVKNISHTIAEPAMV